MPQAPSAPSISLLWPPDTNRRLHDHTPRLEGPSVSNLDLESTAAALSLDPSYVPQIRAILLHLCDDPAVIRYRQDVMEDLLDSPDLAHHLEDLLPTIATLDQYRYSARPGQTPLHEVVWRAGQLDSYVDCVTGLSAIFAAIERDPRSEGLRRLRDVITQIQADQIFQTLVTELPGILENLRSIASVTIGVNLDDELRPVEATLLSINKRKFRGVSYSLLNLLFSREEKRGDWEGIAPLHSVPRQAAALQGSNTHGYDLDNPMLYPLFRDLSQVLKQVSRPVAGALQRYVRVNTQFLGELRIELAFYLGAARLIERIRAGGLPVCRPELVPQTERVCELEATYNLNLAVRTLAKGERDLSRIIITNDALFGPEGRIFVLTGPNQGGKTTYTQAIGLVQVLAQAGLYVPGTRARISPVDNIYTHFPVEEQPAQETGRLGEEAQRLGEIFARATRHSLVLLNESLSSTSPGESLYLARDIVGILRLLGARAVYSTHIHELAAAVDELNRDTPGDSTVISLISLVSDNGHAGEPPEDIRCTYRIVPGPPMGRSYAREIASRYGISYEQLEQLLRTRGVLDEED